MLHSTIRGESSSVAEWGAVMPNPIDNMQPSLALTEVILLEGIYPSSEFTSIGSSVGSIRHFGFNFAPTGTAQTHGQLLSIASNTALFSLIGTFYGGNGVNTFGLPDFDTRLSVGVGQGPGLTDWSLGQISGFNELPLVRPNMPGTVGGSSIPFENTADSMAVRHVINVEGVFLGSGLDALGLVWEFAGNIVPGGTLECNGQLLPISQYDALFNLIGTTYGGDGQETFALPDLRGRTIVGDSDSTTVGEVAGSETGFIGVANLPVEMGGGGQPIANSGPTLTMTYVISLSGIFPSQNGGSGDYSIPYLGEILTYAGPANQLPNGWVECRGQLLPIAQNQALFSLLGTSYGGDGRTTFALPDLRGRAIVGADPDNVSGIGTTHGSDTIALTLDDIPGLNVQGTAADNVLFGANADDLLFGLDGNDTMTAYAGNDWLDGGIGADTMNGGTGSDSYVVDAAGDVVNESPGQGIDTILTDLATYSLGALPNVEQLVGLGDFDQAFSGNGANNWIDGGFGADDMAGGLGDDTYLVDNAGDIVSEVAGEGTDTVRSSISYVLGDTVENLILTGADAINGFGNALANTIIGNGAANILDGAAGGDSMRGGLGNDTYYVDDALDRAIEDAGGGTDTVRASVSFTLGVNVENLILTGAAAINGVGNALANTMIGNGAANILNGGAGVDAMRGGLGDDTYYVDNVLDRAIEDAGGGTDTVRSTITLTLGPAIENLILMGSDPINGIGNALDNIIIGNAAANIINGGVGIDAMRGGPGDDTYYVDNALDRAIEELGGGIDTVRSGITFTLRAEVENLILTGSNAVTGYGNALANTIIGNSAANILNGGTGIDAVRGGLGDDTYYVDESLDRSIEDVGAGNDKVISTATYTLGANVEELQLTGGGAIDGRGNALDNRVTGNGADNDLFGLAGNDRLYGGGGADDLYGGLGIDVLQGAAGADRYFFDTTPSSSTNFDVIADFSIVDDTIVLDQSAFAGFAVLGTLSAAGFYAGAAAHDADDRIVYNSANGRIYYDADGIGGAAQVLVATVTAGLALTNADFLIVA